MVHSSLLLAAYLGSGLALPVQSNPHQSCFVFGDVFWSLNQTTAILSSNCPIQIRRKNRLVTMIGGRLCVQVLIPEVHGMHEFFYRWGNPIARFDGESVSVMVKLAEAAGEE